MKKKYRNVELLIMSDNLEPLLSYKGKLGYTAARNYRTIADCLTEYNKFRLELVQKYGEEIKDENGNLISIQVPVKSDKFRLFADEMAQYNNIEHEVDIMTLPYDVVMDQLSGREFLDLDWMFE